MKIIKIGFTTKSFEYFLKTEKIEYSDILSWAETGPYRWVEVRDGDLSISTSRIKEIGQLASDRGMEAHLAWDGTDLGDRFDLDQWRRQLDKARLFGSDRYSRVTIAPALVDRTTAGYAERDFAMVIDNCRLVVTEAIQRNVCLVFENSFEALVPRDEFMGIQEVLRTMPDVQLCLDYSNLLSKTQLENPLDERQILDFVSSNTTRIPYVHLKSTRNNELIPWFESSGDVSVPELLTSLTESEYLCIELPVQEDLNVLQKRIAEAADFLADR